MKEGEKLDTYSGPQLAASQPNNHSKVKRNYFYVGCFSSAGFLVPPEANAIC